MEKTIIKLNQAELRAEEERIKKQLRIQFMQDFIATMILVGGFVCFVFLMYVVQYMATH